MYKIEYVWRELLYQAIEKKNPYFQLSSLAETFKLSTSVVSHAIEPLRNMGMVRVGKQKSLVRDTEKLLYFWATRRNLKNEVVYSTWSPLSVFEREASMPSIVIPTAYTAYRFDYKDAPADYDNIYLYADDVSSIEKRFPKRPIKEPNIFILKPDTYLKKYKKLPLAQLFVDLWNLPEWYRREFTESVLHKIQERIGL